MNRDEFCSLPATVALGLLWDNCSEIRVALATVAKPQVPRPPKYDRRIYQRKGYQWASEMDLRGLQFWHDRYAKSAADEEKKPEWRERDAKSARELGYWIAWRRVEPTAVWSGERDREQVTASAPHAKPFVYERAPRADQLPAEPQGNPFGDDDTELPY